MVQLEEIRRKSDENKQAAELLILSHKYASSIHCSYYMLLQHAMNFVYKKKGKTIDELIQEAPVKNGERKPGHHVITRNYLMDILRTYPDKKTYREFRDNFNTLKILREKADYLNEKCSEGDANTSFEKSKDLIKILI